MCGSVELERVEDAEMKALYIDGSINVIKEKVEAPMCYWENNSSGGLGAFIIGGGFRWP